MLARTVLLTLLILASRACPALAWDQFSSGDPFWVLLHEPALADELKLAPTQRTALRKKLDELDLRCFPFRNQSATAAQSGLTKIYEEVADELKTLLKPQQARRLNEVLLWRIGISSLLREDVAARMKYSDSQKKKIQEIIKTTQEAATELEQQAAKGEPREPLEKKYTELRKAEQSQINKLLKSEQKQTWKELLGQPFDVTRLGNAAFKAPELRDSKEWINSEPLALEKLKGKVVVIHFYACGCINCIHNYPWYHEWAERYREQDVVLIGIHTPETQTERDLAHVRSKAAAEKFKFPVLLDVQSENWNAWGNSMWPTVYVIDKRGYLRTFWQGELKWQGNDGEKYIRGVIDLLLEEPAR